MKTTIKPSARGLLAAALLLSCTATLAVPKAAENAAAEVSIDAAAVHPKPPQKAAKSSPAATPKASKAGAAGKAAPRKGTSAKPKTKTNAKATAKSKSRK